MNLTKVQCQEFFSNPTQNPLTGRKIEKNKGTYQKLMKECQEMMYHKVDIKDKMYYIPPMGPMMHWNKFKSNYVDRQNNMIDMMNYFVERLDELEKFPMMSRMELDEIHDILKEAKKMFKGDTDYEGGIEEEIERVKKLKKQSNIFDDVPKKSVVKSCWKEIYPNRLHMREEVNSIHNSVKNYILTMEGSIKENDIQILIRKGNIQNNIVNKSYLDYLIKHNIFTYDDIYKRTFTSEKQFDELVELHKKYSVLYKKLEGKSP